VATSSAVACPSRWPVPRVLSGLLGGQPPWPEWRPGVQFICGHGRIGGEPVALFAGFGARWPIACHNNCSKRCSLCCWLGVGIQLSHVGKRPCWLNPQSIRWALSSDLFRFPLVRLKCNYRPLGRCLVGLASPPGQMPSIRPASSESSRIWCSGWRLALSPGAGFGYILFYDSGRLP